MSLVNLPNELILLIASLMPSRRDDDVRGVHRRDLDAVKSLRQVHPRFADAISWTFISDHFRCDMFRDRYSTIIIINHRLSKDCTQLILFDTVTKPLGKISEWTEFRLNMMLNFSLNITRNAVLTFHHPTILW
jgi:hypothetical protein